MAQITLSIPTKVLDIVKKIGRTVYWLSLPILLIVIVYGQYLQFHYDVSSTGILAGNQALIFNKVHETCTPRAF